MNALSNYRLANMKMQMAKGADAICAAAEVRYLAWEKLSRDEKDIISKELEEADKNDL